MGLLYARVRLDSEKLSGLRQAFYPASERVSAGMAPLGTFSAARRAHFCASVRRRRIWLKFGRVPLRDFAQRARLFFAGTLCAICGERLGRKRPLALAAHVLSCDRRVACREKRKEKRLQIRIKLLDS
jgi:hypothetical protein